MNPKSLGWGMPDTDDDYEGKEPSEGFKAHWTHRELELVDTMRKAVEKMADDYRFHTPTTYDDYGYYKERKANLRKVDLLKQAIEKGRRKETAELGREKAKAEAALAELEHEKRRSKKLEGQLFVRDEELARLRTMLASAQAAASTLMIENQTLRGENARLRGTHEDPFADD